MKQFQAQTILSKPRENALIVHLRVHKKLSINQISTVVGHSTRTVWATVKVNEQRLSQRIDRRHLSCKRRILDMKRFRRNLTELKVRAKLFLQGWLSTLEEAFNIRSVPLPLLRSLLGKNSTAVNEADEPP